MNPAKRFEGRLAVITGVSRKGQVGEAVARHFGELGANLAILDRTPGEVNARAEEFRAEGMNVSAHHCDLSDPAALGTVASSVASSHPDGVAALVCLAGGFAASGPVDDSDVEIWNRQLSINLTTAYLTTRAFLPHVRRGQGAIVYFSSAAALPGGSVGEIAAYAAAKSGVATLMRAVAQSEGANGVRANALAPTSIRTATNMQAMGDNQRYVERETVAAWVAYLCSPESGPVSGQIIKLG
jgi:NAD(P)-dependent dehydrogenase (short-subunit alcohol dehydrogenase family)